MVSAKTDNVGKWQVLEMEKTSCQVVGAMQRVERGQLCKNCGL